jgi:hypothetical protein
MMVACKKDAKEASVEQLSANAGSKNALAVAAAEGSGWTEITATEEAEQRVHLDNGSGDTKTRAWNNGDAWYINASGSTSGSSFGSNNVASYTYNSTNKTNTFTMSKAPGNRSEIRIQDDYYQGSRQFEGVITINDKVFANNAVFQIWGGTTTATLMQIRGDGSVNGGQLRVFQNGEQDALAEGDRTIATNILNTPARINVIHIQGNPGTAPGKVVIYVNGVKKYTFYENIRPSSDRGNTTRTNYLKYGNYGRESEDANKTGSVVTWSNVRLWKDGTDAPAASQAIIRQGCNYTGWSASLGVGNYTLSELQALGFVNDDASSLRVPVGLRVRVYANNNFDTLIGTYTSDQSCFSSTVNDRISSIRVDLAP